MMASVSIAARESLRVSTVSLLNSQERSLAVRKVHFPPIRTRWTPRVAYSSCSRRSAARTSTPCGSRSASDASSSGSPEANSIASNSRSSSARTSPALSSSSSAITTFNFGIAGPPLFLAVRRRRRHAARIGHPVVSRLALAHVDRRKCPLLVHFHDPLAHHFERGGKARREHRRRKRRLDHVRDQKFVEPRPIGRLADQPLERFARLGQRPDGAFDEAHMGERRLLPLLRVSREQVVERRAILRMLDVGDRLGLAAPEHVAIELRAAEQAFGDVADGLQTLEPQGQRNRHILGALALGRVRFRQQQARLQIGEPRRHHEIVGRQLESELARLLDEGEILVCERQDRNFGEVDLLLAGEREQQVEGAFEALDIDHQCRFARRPVHCEVGFELDLVGVHEIALRALAPASMSAVHSARSAARSCSKTCPRRLSAASARAAASPASTGTADATARISSSSPLQWRTRSQPAAIAARERSSIEPDKAPMEISSPISRPRNPSQSRITSRTRVTEVVAGAIGSIAVYTIWAVIPSGRSESGRNAAKSVVLRVSRSVSTMGSAPWLSAVARPCPGICLSTGRTPPARRPSATPRASKATFSALSP